QGRAALGHVWRAARVPEGRRRRAMAAQPDMPRPAAAPRVPRPADGDLAGEGVLEAGAPRAVADTVASIPPGIAPRAPVARPRKDRGPGSSRAAWAPGSSGLHSPPAWVWVVMDVPIHTPGRSPSTTPWEYSGAGF